MPLLTQVIIHAIYPTNINIRKPHMLAILFFCINITFADDFPSKAQLQSMVTSGAAVLKKHQAYFVQSGKIYEMDLATGEVEYVKASSKVKSLVLYTDTLIALRTNGDIFMLNPKDGDWIELGNSTTSLMATKRDLIALTKKGELWVFQGSPGELNITFIPIITSTGKTTIVTFMPMIDGREVAFLNTGISNVAKISLTREQDILIEYEKGQREHYSELKISLDDTSKKLSLSKDISDLQLDTAYESGKAYRIKKLLIKKSKGELYATVQYKLDKFWFPSSPKYKFPLPKILSWFDDDNPKNDLKDIPRFFNEVLLPASRQSKASWQISHCAPLLQ